MVNFGNIMKEKRYLIKDIIKILKISRKTYYNWEKKDKIPASKREPMSGYRFWTQKDLEKLRKITGR